MTKDSHTLSPRPGLGHDPLTRQRENDNGMPSSTARGEDGEAMAVCAELCAHSRGHVGPAQQSSKT